MIYLKIVELFILTILPTLLWLKFFSHKDYHQEPLYVLRRIFLISFIFTPFIGIIQWCANENIKIASGFISSPASDFISSPVINCSLINAPFIFFNQTTLNIIILLIGAFIEELFKFFSVRLALWGGVKKEFDEPVDAMVYLITAALGFSAAENLMYAVSSGFQSGFLSDNSWNSLITGQAEILRLIFLRSVLTTLLHILSSGIFGYFFAKAYFYYKNAKFYFLKAVMSGLGYATLIHFSFNLIIKVAALGNNVVEVPLKILALLVLLFFSYIIVIKEFQKLQLNSPSL